MLRLPRVGLLTDVIVAKTRSLRCVKRIVTSLLVNRTFMYPNCLLDLDLLDQRVNIVLWTWHEGVLLYFARLGSGLHAPQLELGRVADHHVLAHQRVIHLRTALRWAARRPHFLLTWTNVAHLDTLVSWPVLNSLFESSGAWGAPSLGTNNYIAATIIHCTAVFDLAKCAIVSVALCFLSLAL